MPRLLARDPGFVFLSAQGRLVECPRFEEARPVGRCTYLLQQVHVVLDLLGGHPTRHENPAQHQVFDVEPGVLARRNVVPGHRLGDLRLVGHALSIEHAQRPQRPRAPLGHGLDRIVDPRVDVLAHQLNRHLATAAVGDVREFRAGLLLDCDRDDLIFLLRARPAHLELSAAGLDRVEVFLGCLVGRLRVDPEDEVVQSHHLHRRQVAPVERRMSRKRGREQVRQGDDDLVRITFRLLHVEKPLRARPTRLVDDHHRLLHQLVLGNDALNNPGHLVGAPTGAGRNDELHRFRGFPGRKRLNRYGRGSEQRQRSGPAPIAIGKVAHRSPPIAKTPNGMDPPSASAVPSILFTCRISRVDYRHKLLTQP